MKAISPIVAIVVLMLMTVAAAGMAYLTITGYQTQSQAGTQGGIETIGTSTRTQVKIESVAAGKIYLRNMGSETFENPDFYVEGKPLNVTGPDECLPGKVCVFTVTENITCIGDCVLSMGQDMPVGTTVKVEEEELEPETICGDGDCDADENTQNCWTDCGGDLKLEKNQTFNPPSFFFHAFVEDVANDPQPEIICTGEHQNSDYYADIFVLNYTSGNVNRETNISINVGSSTIPYSMSVFVEDVDNDGTNEIITGGYIISTTPTFSDLRVYNVTNNNLELENETNWTSDTKTEISSVSVYNLDGSSVPEIITAGVWDDTSKGKWQICVHSM
jgi:flagellin-like protein